MKKLFAFLLMLVMLSSLTAGAFAADELSFDIRILESLIIKQTDV